MALRRDQIVAAAIDLLDEGGLEQLSLRRLAERLDVGASTLYWHVRDKRHLLDLMSEAFTLQIRNLVEPADDWWTEADRWARALFAALLAHPDGARIMAGNRISPEAFPDLEVILAQMVAAGFDPPGALQALLAIGGYVIGVAIDVQEEGRRPPEELGEAAEDGAVMASYPLLVAAGYPEPQARFDAGLRFLLDGIRASVEGRPGFVEGRSGAGGG